jgi:hypothetical protein
MRVLAMITAGLSRTRVLPDEYILVLEEYMLPVMEAVSGVVATPAEAGPLNGKIDVRSLRDADDDTDRRPRLLALSESGVLALVFVVLVDAMEGAFLPRDNVSASRASPGVVGMGSAGGGGGASMYVGDVGDVVAVLGETDVGWIPVVTDPKACSETSAVVGIVMGVGEVEVEAVVVDVDAEEAVPGGATGMIVSWEGVSRVAV